MYALRLVIVLQFLASFANGFAHPLALKNKRYSLSFKSDRVSRLNASTMKSNERSKDGKNERTRRLERREKKEVKRTGIVTKDNLAVDDLETQLLSKYGSNEYRKVLEEGWEDIDEDDIGKSKNPRRERAKRFEGFHPNKRDDEETKASNRESALANEENFLRGITTLSSSGSSSSSSSSSSLSTMQPGDTENNSLIKPTSKRRVPLLGNIGNTVEKKVKKVVDFELEDIFEEEKQTSSVSVYNKRGQGIEVKENFENVEYDKEEDNLVADWVVRKKEEEEASRSGPLNAVHGFRLRRPPPMTPEQMAIREKKVQEVLIREEQKKIKRKAKKEAEANEFLPFSFEDSKDISMSEGDQLFSTKSFMEIGVENDQVLQNLEKMNIFSPTKIQVLAVPAMSQGKDVVLQAQTGSGKTLAFLLPLLDIVDPSRRKVQAIILAPSRELVVQIAQVGENLFKDTDINIEAIIGGANVHHQVKRLRENKPQIVVATPGRLAELVFRLEKLRLGMVRAVIIDEVDNMLQEPYIGEIQTLLDAAPLMKKSASSSIGSNRDEIGMENDKDFDDGEVNKLGAYKRLFCLASATSGSFSEHQFFSRFGTSAGFEKIAVSSASQLPQTITHGLISTNRMRALEQLKRMLKSKPEVKRALIFVNDPHRVEIICEQLLDMGMVAAPLHGESSKEDRKDIIARLRDGRLNLVVTTELAARGLDIPDLSHVINFELPTDAQHYVHRAGRCGRAGKTGLVINFANPETKFVVRRFGKQLGIKVRDCEIRDGTVHLKS